MIVIDSYSTFLQHSIKFSSLSQSGWLYKYCGIEKVIFSIMIGNIQKGLAPIVLLTKLYGFKTHLYDCNSSIR